MRKFYIISLVATIAFILGLAYAEQMTFSTYYPAPYGVYNQMVVRTLGVGDSSQDGNINNLDAPDPNDPLQENDLWVAGSVGIGTTNPEATLHISRDTGGTEVRIESIGNLGANLGLVADQGNIANYEISAAANGKFIITDHKTAGAPQRLIIDSNGNIIVGGTTVHSSDIRSKKKIRTIPDALEKVLSLRGVNFYWKEDEGKDPSLQMGVIAQEVEKVIPEVVYTSNDKQGMKSVAYSQLLAVLIEAIKEQQKRIETLEAKLNIGQ